MVFILSKVLCDDLVLFSGYAKLPIGITANEIYKVVGIVVLVKVATGEIVEADCTLATKLARRHIADSLVGYSLKDGVDALVHLIDRIYQGGAKKSLITTLRIIYDKYRSYTEEHHVHPAE